MGHRLGVPILKGLQKAVCHCFAIHGSPQIHSLLPRLDVMSLPCEVYGIPQNTQMALQLAVRGNRKYKRRLSLAKASISGEIIQLEYTWRPYSHHTWLRDSSI